MLEVIDEIPGAADLIKWFGSWPSFHDAEVLDLELHRTGLSKVRINTWERTDQVDDRGYFVCTKYVTVTSPSRGLKTFTWTILVIRMSSVDSF